MRLVDAYDPKLMAQIVIVHANGESQSYVMNMCRYCSSDSFRWYDQLVSLLLPNQGQLLVQPNNTLCA